MAKKAELEAKLKDFNSKAAAGSITDEELREAHSALAELADVKAQLKRSDDSKGLMQAIADLNPDDNHEDSDAQGAPKSLGEWFVKNAGQELVRKKGVSGASVVAPEYKAASDPQVTPTGLDAYSTFYDRTIVQAYRRRLVLADLLGSGTLTNNNAVTYLVESPTVEGKFTTVAQGGIKPQLHFGDPTTRTDALKKIAGVIQFSDEMIEDFGFLVSEINNRGLYLLGLAEEAQLLNGSGSGSNVLGLLNRSGIQTEASAGVADNPDAIFRATTKISTATGLAADGVVINPLDYQNLRLRKDGNDQYYGGGFFQGQYGQDGIQENPPIWGLRTVVTPMVAAGTVLVGAFKQAATVYRKGGVRVESTNSHADSFVSNIVTTRIEERVALACRVPAGIVDVTLKVA